MFFKEYYWNVMVPDRTTRSTGTNNSWWKFWLQSHGPALPSFSHVSAFCPWWWWKECCCTSQGGTWLDKFFDRLFSAGSFPSYPSVQEHKQQLLCHSPRTSFEQEFSREKQLRMGVTACPLYCCPVPSLKHLFFTHWRGYQVLGRSRISGNPKSGNEAAAHWV